MSTINNVQRFEGSMLAKTTIYHGGDEKTGSTPTLRRIYMYVDGMGEVAMPHIHGNAIRGKLRRLLMFDFIKNLGMKPQDLKTKIYHLFFSGGALESTEGSEGIIDLELRRKLRELLKPMALLGGTVGNQMIPGLLKVGHAFPICKEYKMYLPDFLSEDDRTKNSVREFTDESFQTRRDDLRDKRKDKDETPTQMKIEYECFIPGTKFYHWFTVEWADEVETSCFGRMIELFKYSPFVGGMAATGNGEIMFTYQPEIPSSDPYIKFLKDNKDSIVDMIHKLETII